MVDPKIVLVTIRQSAHGCPSYESEIQRARLIASGVAGELPIVGAIDSTKDVVKARSNAVSLVLKHAPQASHILWIDDDVIIPSDKTIPGLIASGYDVVGCPVPRKRIARWGSEKEACDFAYRASVSGNQQTDEYGCVEVDGLPFGLILTSTECLKRMRGAYLETLGYRDGELESVALFQLMLLNSRLNYSPPKLPILLSEDYSFCERWKMMGGKVYMRCEPAHHVGTHTFKGYIEGLQHVS